ncbi:MAG: methyltransferase domain-containing protein [Acidobacteriota bacterium]
MRILSRVMQPTTHALLRRAEIQPGMSCLDIGCGGGDVAFDMARMVGPAGRVVGTDIDHEKLKLARHECSAHGLENVEFLFADITKSEIEEQFDLVHARFILTHLPDPAGALTRMSRALRPGGVIAVEDIDFRGYFCEPECPAFWRYVELYTETARRRGADANIGPRLPGLLAAAGFDDVQMNIVQPAGTTGEVKLVTPLTMENIADAVVAEGLATAEEIAGLVAELYKYARTDGTIGGAPRIVEAWGRKRDGRDRAS